jgi:hypothetical protein
MARQFQTKIIAALLAAGLGGCSLAPSLVLPGSGHENAPAGPKVASIMSHLKCELYEATNSTAELPRYQDVQGLVPRVPKPDDGDRQPFSIRAIFSQIEYVAEAQLSLEVTETAGIAPSVNFVQPLSAPATNFTVLASAGYSEAARKKLDLYTSIDFARLVSSTNNLRVNVKDEETFIEKEAVPDTPCQSGRELEGTLGIKESISAALVSSAMTDIAVLPWATATPIKNKPTDSLYTYGAFTVTAEFTITASLNGGPNWTLTKFRGPSLGSNGLLSVQRVPKDTLVMTFVPVCIRRNHTLVGHDERKHGIFKPPLAIGTPVWAYYLPQCAPYNRTMGADPRVAGVNAAKSINFYSRAGSLPAP